MTLSPPSTSTLRRNALTATDVVAMATATYAPTAALYFNTPIAVSFAGSSVPFAFLLATVAMLIVASCMAQLAKHQATAAATTPGSGARWGSGQVSSWAGWFWPDRS